MDGLSEVPKSPEESQKMFNSNRGPFFNTGVLCGKQYDLIVIEINDRKDGLSTWKMIVQMTNCLSVKTLHVLRGNGMINVYFRYNKNVKESSLLRGDTLRYPQTQDNICRGINIRNNGSFVMSPYSYDPVTLIQNRILFSSESCKKSELNISAINQNLLMHFMMIKEHDTKIIVMSTNSTKSDAKNDSVKKTDVKDNTSEKEMSSLDRAFEKFFSECTSGKISQVLQHLKRNEKTRGRTVIRTTDLYKVYHEWCGFNDINSISAKRFTELGISKYLKSYNDGIKTSVGGSLNSGVFYYLSCDIIDN